MLNDGDIEDIYRYASQGLSQKQIGHMLGYCEATMQKFKREDERVAPALDRGKSAGIQAVANALYNKATIEGDTTSMIFYLKAKDRENWSEVNRHQVFGDDEEAAVKTENTIKFNADEVAEKVKDVLSRT